MNNTKYSLKKILSYILLFIFVLYNFPSIYSNCQLIGFNPINGCEMYECYVTVTSTVYVTNTVYRTVTYTSTYYSTVTNTVTVRVTKTYTYYTTVTDTVTVTSTVTSTNTVTATTTRYLTITTTYVLTSTVNSATATTTVYVTNTQTTTTTVTASTNTVTSTVTTTITTNIATTTITTTTTLTTTSTVYSTITNTQHTTTTTTTTFTNTYYSTTTTTTTLNYVSTIRFRGILNLGSINQSFVQSIDFPIVGERTIFYLNISNLGNATVNNMILRFSLTGGNIRMFYNNTEISSLDAIVISSEIPPNGYIIIPFDMNILAFGSSSLDIYVFVDNQYLGYVTYQFNVKPENRQSSLVISENIIYILAIFITVLLIWLII